MSDPFLMIEGPLLALPPPGMSLPGMSQPPLEQPLFEQEVIVAGEGTPDKERALYSVPPGKSSSNQPADRNPLLIVGGIAAVALIVAIYAAVKK